MTLAKGYLSKNKSQVSDIWTIGPLVYHLPTIENPFKRHGMYPSISKCNAKKCNCCNHLCSKTTITSSVNGRTFSVVNDSDLD